MIIVSETVSVTDIFNLTFTAVVFGIPSSILIVHLSRHLCKERKQYKELKKASPEFSEEHTRKFKIAKVKYALMLIICISELLISLGIVIPNLISSLCKAVNIYYNHTDTNHNYLYNECVGEELNTAMSKNLFLRLIVGILVSSLLAFLFLIRSLCHVLTNVYIERKQISNFKTTLPILAFEVMITTSLGIFNRTLPFQYIVFIVALLIEFGLLVKATVTLRKSIIMRHFELNRDYPNSILSAKALRDIKYFTLTSRFTLVAIFFYSICIICWLPAEGLFNIIINFPCFLKFYYGIGNSNPQMILADPETALLLYELIHVMQNIAIFISNTTILLLCGIIFAQPILSCLRCKQTRYSSYAIQRPELITSLLDYNVKCYAEKNGIF